MKPRTTLGGCTGDNLRIRRLAPSHARGFGGVDSLRGDGGVAGLGLEHRDAEYRAKIEAGQKAFAVSRQKISSLGLLPSVGRASYGMVKSTGR